MASAMRASVCTPVTTSTSFITGTGLKKCMPSPVDPGSEIVAISVIESEKVFVARRTGAEMLQRGAQHSLLDRQILDDSLDDNRARMGLGVRDRRRGDEPIGCVLPERRVASAQAADDVVDGGAELPLVWIDQAHQVPYERELCDAATHRSGTDNADVWTLIRFQSCGRRGSFRCKLRCEVGQESIIQHWIL